MLKCFFSTFINIKTLRKLNDKSNIYSFKNTIIMYIYYLQKLCYSDALISKHSNNNLITIITNIHLKKLKCNKNSYISKYCNIETLTQM